jgi:Uma2 family endonuclease
MEILRPANREHEEVTKRVEYARAGISEYWIVDPGQMELTVLKLASDAYAEHGVFAGESLARSVLLPGFSVDVAKLFRDATGEWPRLQHWTGGHSTFSIANRKSKIANPPPPAP